VAWSRRFAATTAHRPQAGILVAGAEAAIAPMSNRWIAIAPNGIHYVTTPEEASLTT
jgi:hypothetical protein